MWDRVANFVYNFIRDLSNTTFYIVMAIMITLGFYFIGQFLKANKKESAKVAKVSNLLLSILIAVVFIVMVNIRY